MSSYRPPTCVRIVKYKGFDGLDILLEWEWRSIENYEICPSEVKEGIGCLERTSSEFRKWMQLINIGFFFPCGILLLTVEHSSFLTAV